METDLASLRRVGMPVLRVGLGVFFLFISIPKILDTAAFAASISAYRIVSGDAALIAATVIPWMELLCGLCLISGLLVRGSALLVLAMLGVFTVAVFSALRRGLDIGCGCYTQDPLAERLGWWKILENTLFACVCVLIYRQEGHRSTLERFLLRRTHPISRE